MQKRKGNRGENCTAMPSSQRHNKENISTNYESKENICSSKKCNQGTHVQALSDTDVLTNLL